MKTPGLLKFSVISLLFAVCNAFAVDTKDLKHYGRFYSTFYYVVYEQHYAVGTDASVKDVDGKIISKVSANYKRDLDMEGTGKLRDGRIINYARKVDGEVRYKVVQAPWGKGVGDCDLQPYKSIAVDPRVMPLGTTVYIPEAKGVTLPDGTIHDGVFYAQDVGSAIQGRHVDFFARDGHRSSKPFEDVGIETKTFVNIYKLNHPDPLGCHNLDPNLQSSEEVQAFKSKLQSLLSSLDENITQQKTVEAKAIQKQIQVLNLRWQWSHKPRWHTNEAGLKFKSNDFKNKEIKITFDGEINTTVVNRLLAILNQRRVKATFFLMGSEVEENKKLVQEIHNQGHLIGNNTFFRPQMTKMIVEAAKYEIEDAQEALKNVLGFYPTYFRFPYGDSNPKTMNVLKNITPKLSLADEVIDSFDWVERNPHKIVERALSQVQLYGGGTVNFSMTYSQSAEALLEILSLF